ncbi:hypothetical protein [Natronococcus occultus]|uniref:Uncharacterized protein n=1 Tax=Natronococcus occultus SP4 TaxID=694430 RepID=L0JT89_9EURY|nr:hypothetical protein [Natronococcus occultus]AGB35951.1 hypothetical protein Natoc_0069 [Natronococcus occultus SP4]
MAINSLIGLTFVFAVLTAASYVGTRLAMRDAAIWGSSHEDVPGERSDGD